MANILKLLQFIQSRDPDYKIPLTAKVKYQPGFDAFKYAKKKGVELTEKELDSLLKGVKTQKAKDELTKSVIEFKGNHLDSKDIEIMVTHSDNRAGILKTVEAYSKIAPVQTAEFVNNDNSLKILMSKGKNISLSQISEMMKYNNWADPLILSIIGLKGGSMTDQEIDELVNGSDSFIKVASALIDTLGKRMTNGDLSGIRPIISYAVPLNQSSLDFVVKRILKYTDIYTLSSYLRQKKMNKLADKLENEYYDS